jgi:hypothetical protein
MNRIAALCLTLFSLTACSVPVSTISRPDSYYAAYDSGPVVPESLFSGDAAVLSDEAIRSILDYKYLPPAQSRIALLPFGRELWSQWSEELSLSTETMKSDVIDRLLRSPKIYDASYLPSILIPESRTVPHLREAAARYQADLLLVYRSYCRSFERYRVFSADESRAFCGVEAVLLDTRTGLVPFTSIASHSFSVKKNDEDMNFRETILKAQLAATAEALSKASGEVVRFLAEQT